MWWNSLGVRRNIVRRLSSVVTTEQRVLKLEEQEEGNKNLEDEIAKIRHAYNDAKERFHKTPDALKEMPKLDPKGYKQSSFIFSFSFRWKVSFL